VVGLEERMEENAAKEILPNGTYARNPVSIAAADATLGVISKDSTHQKIEQTGGALLKGLREILHDKKIEAVVQGYPSMFQVLFTNQDQIHTYREFSRCDQDSFEKFQQCLLKSGIMLDEQNSEPVYTSAAHDDKDVAQTLEAIEACL
jgi:glutamate-1-semialdehyde 2,1-aminomutase